MSTDTTQGELEFRRFVIQEVGIMVAEGIKNGWFNDWTSANKVADRVDQLKAQWQLAARLETLKDVQGVFYRDGMHTDSKQQVYEMVVEAEAQLSKLKGESK